MTITININKAQQLILPGCAVFGCAVLLQNVGKKPNGINCNVILQECLKVGEKQADENKNVPHKKDSTHCFRDICI
jgi:hypothetical protein